MSYARHSSSYSTTTEFSVAEFNFLILLLGRPIEFSLEEVLPITEMLMLSADIDRFGFTSNVRSSPFTPAAMASFSLLMSTATASYGGGGVHSDPFRSRVLDEKLDIEADCVIKEPLFFLE